MKFFSVPVVASLAIGALAAPALRPNYAVTPRGTNGTVQGFDISHYQPNVNFASAYSGGLRFVYIKATQGTTYVDPDFASHWSGATSAGFIRGAYHFADGTQSATSEAAFFIKNGGGWTNDGKTLPGMLDLEGSCISVAWIQEFSNAYHSSTGRYPVLYSSPSWWESCTSNSNAFVSTNALMMACYDATPCATQGGWPSYTIWQYKDSNTYGGDSDVFNGDLSQLQAFASGS